jgi:hypothetical protein
LYNEIEGNCPFCYKPGVIEHMAITQINEISAIANAAVIEPKHRIDILTMLSSNINLECEEFLTDILRLLGCITESFTTILSIAR